MSLWPAISEQISTAQGTRFTIRQRRNVGGGCINTCHVIEDGGKRYFVKTNDVLCLDMFAAESCGLQEIIRTSTVIAPEPLCLGTADNTAFLVLEYLEFGNTKPYMAGLFGQQLAAMHRVTRAQFGWDIDNTIGSTPQINSPTSDWSEFWKQHRLGFQLSLAAQNGYRGVLQQQGEQLLGLLPALFADHSPAAALLHGDLWSGNYAFTVDGKPVIFDPAVYYGDRETDVAMTELFGGFPAEFYHAYQEAFPLPDGYLLRKKLYNLYHILNHLNLFGGGYLNQAQQMIESLLNQLR